MARRASAIARWLFPILALAVLAAWVASARMYAGWRSSVNDSIAFVLKGRAEVYISTSRPPGFKSLGPPSPGVSAGRCDRLWMWDQSWQWRPRLRMGDFGFYSVVPLWMAFLAFGIPGVLLWRARMVRLRTNCRFCDYDLSGLPSGAPCPECGKVR